MELIFFSPENFDRVYRAASYGATILFLCLVLVMVASLIDMWTGVEAARASKEKIRSNSLRKTIAKVLDYYKIILFGLLIDILGLVFPWYGLPYAVLLCTLGVLTIEGKSVVENLNKKKSQAADVVSVVEQIIKCVDQKDAMKIVEELKNISHKDE